ncbi:MAG: glycoside hydrolase family 3 N-terminal domain-containing protein, partial [Streptosporangiaceae bacterium]
GATVARGLRSLGINWNFAPVLDVNNNPGNPVIAERSFGEDPDAVARLAGAWMRGSLREGVACCVKHFPGHGATPTDSHRQVARLARSLAELESTELPPFAAAVSAGTAAVMTGHLLVPSLDPNALATVSTAITSGLLRGRMGFDATVVTDALEMKPVADTIGVVDAVVGALAAGADTIETGVHESPELVEEIPAAVQAALDDGRLAIGRLWDASRRTARLASSRPVRGQAAAGSLDGLAARCVETLGRLPELARPLVIEARPNGSIASGPLPWSLAEPLSRRVRSTEAVTVDGPESLAGLDARSRGRSLVVVVRDPGRHPWQQELVRLAERHPSGVVVDVGWPARLPRGLPAVRTRGIAPGLLEAAAVRLAAF